MNEGGGYDTVILVGIVIAVWFWLGDPGRDMRRLVGQQTYEDQTFALHDQVTKKRIGSSGDVWLVKNGLAGRERVALFFGYMDDWDTCYEFANMYMQRHPSDRYNCEFAN